MGEVCLLPLCEDTVLSPSQGSTIVFPEELFNLGPQNVHLQWVQLIPTDEGDVKLWHKVNLGSCNAVCSFTCVTLQVGGLRLKLQDHQLVHAESAYIGGPPPLLLTLSVSWHWAVWMWMWPQRSCGCTGLTSVPRELWWASGIPRESLLGAPNSKCPAISTKVAVVDAKGL